MFRTYDDWKTRSDLDDEVQGFATYTDLVCVECGAPIAVDEPCDDPEGVCDACWSRLEAEWNEEASRTP